MDVIKLHAIWISIYEISILHSSNFENSRLSDFNSRNKIVSEDVNFRKRISICPNNIKPIPKPQIKNFSYKYSAAIPLSTNHFHKSFSHQLFSTLIWTIYRRMHRYTESAHLLCRVCKVNPEELQMESKWTICHPIRIPNQVTSKPSKPEWHEQYEWS